MVKSDPDVLFEVNGMLGDLEIEDTADALEQLADETERDIEKVDQPPEFVRAMVAELRRRVLVKRNTGQGR